MLHNDDARAERSTLHVEIIMELLEVCLRTTYFQVDEKFFQQKMAWLGPERLQDFFSHLNSLRPSIQFTMEIESDSEIAFLDVLVIGKGTTLATKIYREPTTLAEISTSTLTIRRM
jgi:hypothetical protein